MYYDKATTKDSSRKKVIVKRRAAETNPWRFLPVSREIGVIYLETAPVIFCHVWSGKIETFRAFRDAVSGIRTVRVELGVLL